MLETSNDNRRKGSISTNDPVKTKFNLVFRATARGPSIALLNSMILLARRQCISRIFQFLPDIQNWQCSEAIQWQCQSCCKIFDRSLDHYSSGERLDYPGDIGKNRSPLEKNFPEIDFSFISKESLWSYIEEDQIVRSRKQAEEHVRESEEDKKARTGMFLLWTTMRPEKTVVLILTLGFTGLSLIFDCSVKKLKIINA